VNATGQPDESFTAAATPGPATLGVTSFQTAWECTGPMPGPQGRPGRKKSRPLARLVSLLGNQKDLGPMAATVLLVVGFTAIGSLDLGFWASPEHGAASGSPAERQGHEAPAGPDPQLAMPSRPQPAAAQEPRVVWATMTFEPEAQAARARQLEEERAVREREAELQAARKELPDVGGVETPSLLNPAERQRLEALIRPSLPREPPARPGGGEEDRSGGPADSQLVSYGRRDLR
jgi:hypothetical protein